MINNDADFKVDFLSKSKQIIYLKYSYFANVQNNNNNNKKKINFVWNTALHMT